MARRHAVNHRIKITVIKMNNINEHDYENVAHLKDFDYLMYQKLKGRTKGMMTFMIGDRCNLKCIYCFTAAGEEVRTLADEYFIKTGKKLELLNDAEYVKLIDIAVNAGISNLILCSEGENTLYGRMLKNIIDNAYDRGIHMVMFTNGTRIDDSLAKYLYRKNIGVITKINSFNKKLNDLLAGNDHRQFRYAPLNNMNVPVYINNLLDAGYDKDKLAVNMVINTLNVAEVENFWDWARDGKTNITPFAEFLDRTGFVKENTYLNVDVITAAAIREKIRNIDIDHELLYPALPENARTLDIRFLINPLTLVIDSRGFVKDHAAIFDLDKTFGLYNEINIEKLLV